MNKIRLPDEELEFQIARLEMRPGDALVARAMRPITSEAAARIRAYIGRALPETKVVVIDANLELSVVSKADAKRLPSAGS